MLHRLSVLGRLLVALSTSTLFSSPALHKTNRLTNHFTIIAHSQAQHQQMSAQQRQNMKRSRSKQRMILTRSVEPSLQTIIEVDGVLEHETEDAAKGSREPIRMHVCAFKLCKQEQCLSIRKFVASSEKVYSGEEVQSDLKHIIGTMDSISELERLLEMYRTISRILDDLKSKSEELQRDRTSTDMPETLASRGA